MTSNDGPPGFDPPPSDVKSKTKSAKRNERKKEKRLQVCFPLYWRWIGYVSDYILHIVRIYLKSLMGVHLWFLFSMLYGN